MEYGISPAAGQNKSATAASLRAWRRLFWENHNARYSSADHMTIQQREAVQ